MTHQHTPASMAAGAAAVSMAAFAVGTPGDPNQLRMANAQDWERCLVHPLHPVPYSPGQTYAANAAHNWTDGARVAIIWISPFFLALFGLLPVSLAIWAVLIVGTVILKCRD